MSQREEFEKFISSPPLEYSINRFPEDATMWSWPGEYVNVSVSLAWATWQAAQVALETELSELREDLTDARSGWESAVMLNNEQAAEITELKYINERLQKHCSELTEQLNVITGKCASFEKANAAYRALEKKRNELSECLPVVRYQGACHD